MPRRLTPERYLCNVCGGKKAFRATTCRKCRIYLVSDQQKANLRRIRLVHGHGTSSRGQASRTYQSWMSMKERCGDPKHKSYADYGGRGITYCERWEQFVNFLADMCERPARTTLGRIDNDGNYESANCEWQDIKTQMRNMRGNRKITFNGETLCLVEWAEKIGLSDDALGKRLENGWSLERALTTPAKRQKNSVCTWTTKVKRVGMGVNQSFVYPSPTGAA